jgi:hypothetical protein
MENMAKQIAITFRERQNQSFVEWKQEFENLESLRNYMRIKMIKWISLRMFVQGVNKIITLKSYFTPGELTLENYRWLLDSNFPDERFILINNRLGFHKF